MTREIRRALEKFPEVASVISKAGRPEDGTDPKPINMTEFLVDLKPEAEWRRGISRAALFDEMDREVRKMPGMDPRFLDAGARQHPREHLADQGQIIVKIFGDDVTVLRELATARFSGRRK